MTRSRSSHGVLGTLALMSQEQQPSHVDGSAVDEVLASVRGLEDRPVSEHVAVFERAHEQLRRALDARSGD